jgi:NifU-like protein involved in Fe-S cluster formation
MRNYSPQVIAHFSHPRNMGALADADVTAEAANPCCGDRIRLYARVQAGRVAACTFLAYGCAVALAMASLLTEAVTCQPIEALAGWDEGLLVTLAGGLGPDQRHCATLGKDVLHALVCNYRAYRSKGVPA